MSDHEAIIAANELFYRAFSTQDLRAMRRIWSGRPDDLCVHPGWERLVGWEAIEASWIAIFSDAAQLQVEAVDLLVDVLGDVARVSCTEVLRAAGSPPGGQDRVAATNLFLRQADGWRLVLHHGSPIADEMSLGGAEFN